ncbi:MAG: hypothetical protein JNK82_18050, partial [Myxococcaceae bacterium]|nr:hypothetical protein [Myxococcaceae bacterium]
DGYPHHDPKRPQSPRAVRALAAEGLEWALGRPVSKSQLKLIERCTAELPMTGRLLHVVGIPHRLGDDLRIGAILPCSDVERWLRAVGWPGTKAQLRELFRLVGFTSGFIHVQVELNETIGPKLALDFNIAQTPNDPRWAPFGKRIVESCGADPERVSAALSWVGSRRVRLPSDELPARLDQQLFFKVTSRPDGLEAKAYLCFHPRYSLL